MTFGIKVFVIKSLLSESLFSVKNALAIAYYVYLPPDNAIIAN